jgi:hypothetical protein
VDERPVVRAADARGLELALRAIGRANARVRTMLERPEDELRRRVPEVSGWSVVEHLFHLSLANDLSLGHVVSLVSGKGMLVRAEGNPSDEAAAVLRRGRIPRGVAQAPRFVRPPEPAQLDLGVLRDIVAEVDARIAEIAAQPVRVLAARGFVPHQLLGDLDAAGWLRFARVHAAHHLVIAREVERRL